MSEVKLSSELRTDLSKSETKRLRREGKIPAIYYFHQQKPLPLVIDQKEFRAAMRTGTQLIDLQIGNKHHNCVVKEMQYHPVTDAALHIDFMGVNLKEVINIKVPIRIIGEAVGVKTFGGVLEQHLWEVEVKCMVSNIPGDINIDVTDLNLGDSINVGHIKLEEAEIQTPVTASIVSVVKATGAGREEEAEEKAEIGAETEAEEDKEGKED